MLEGAIEGLQAKVQERHGGLLQPTKELLRGCERLDIMLVVALFDQCSSILPHQCAAARRASGAADATALEALMAESYTCAATPAARREGEVVLLLQADAALHGFSAQLMLS